MHTDTMNPSIQTGNSADGYWNKRNVADLWGKRSINQMWVKRNAFKLHDFLSDLTNMLQKK